MTGAGKELLDLVDDRVRVSDPREMVDPRKFDHSRVRDLSRHVAASADVDAEITRAMQDQRRGPDRGKDAPDVDLAGHLEDSAGRGRTGAETQVFGPPLFESGLVGNARRPRIELRRTTPIALHGCSELAERAIRRRPRIVGVADTLRVGAVKHKRCDALGVGGGEQHGHRSALGDAEERSPLRAGGVQDGAHVIHSLFQRGQHLDRDPV